MSRRLRNGDSIETVLTSKALNASWNVQPENPNPSYNAHGCCVNHWYRVPVTLCPRISEDIKAPALGQEHRRSACLSGEQARGGAAGGAWTFVPPGLGRRS